MGKFTGPKPSPALAAAIVALVAALFGLAACGGTLSKDEYAERVDEVCAEWSEAATRSEALAEKAIEEGDFQAAGDAYDKVYAGFEKTVDNIESIPVPEGEEEAVSDFLSVLRVQTAAFGRIGEAMRSEDRAVLDDTRTQIAEARFEGQEVAKRTGFSC